MLDLVLTEGIGKGFMVLDPEDGFRKDNSLWFGTCDQCGERVHNSRHTGIWEHTIILETTYHANGTSILSQKSKTVDYCPSKVK
jgi:hypothetical protein